MNKKIIIGVLVTMIFIMLAFAPAVDSHTTANADNNNIVKSDMANNNLNPIIGNKDKLNSLNTNLNFSSYKITNATANYAVSNNYGISDNLNSVHATNFQIGYTNVSIFSVTSQDEYAIFTLINNTISSWSIYHNNVRDSTVQISTMIDGKISVCSQKINETNMVGTINTSEISNHSLASKLATAQPGDARYSLGIFGWAASFTHRELNIIAFALDSGATVATIAALFTSGTIVGIPAGIVFGVAAAIMGIGGLVISGLALDCSNEGYIGIGISGFIFGCNPVPWGY